MSQIVGNSQSLDSKNRKSEDLKLQTSEDVKIQSPDLKMEKPSEDVKIQSPDFKMEKPSEDVKIQSPDLKPDSGKLQPESSVLTKSQKKKQRKAQKAGEDRVGEVEVKPIVVPSKEKESFTKSSFIIPVTGSNKSVFPAVSFGKPVLKKVLWEFGQLGINLNFLRKIRGLIPNLEAVDYFIEDETLLDELMRDQPCYRTVAEASVATIACPEMAILHDNEHFSAYCHGLHAIYAFETLPTRIEITGKILSEKYHKPIVILPWIDQSVLKQRNLCGYLSVLALMSLDAECEEQMEDIFSYVFEPTEEDEYENITISIGTEPTVVQGELKQPVYVENNDKYDPNYKSKYQDKADHVMLMKEDELTSNYEEMKKVFSVVQDYAQDFFKDIDIKATLFITSIIASLSSLIFLAFSNFKKKNIKAAIISTIVSFISLLLTAIIYLDASLEFPKLSIKSLFTLIESYWKPKITYSKDDDPRVLLDESPFAAQLLQIRNYSNLPVYFSKISDEVLVPYLERFPVKLLSDDDIESVIAEVTKPKKQAKTFEEVLDLVMSPIAAILVLFGFILPGDEKNPNLIERAMKECKSKLTQLKTHKENMVNIREQFLDFFNPSETFTNRLIRQKKRNIEAVQPPIAVLATDPAKYNNLMQALNNSNQLSKSIMSANGKNVMFQAYMASVSAVENKVLEYKRAITDVIGRQEPTAVYFHGEKGIGKSTMLTTTLTKDLCKKLGLNPTTFNSRPNPDKFYSVYCGESIAYMDEVGDMQDCSSVFELINQLVSTVSVNIPSAFVKDQPFVSPFLFMISNYDLTTSLATSGKKPASAAAMRTRFIEIEVRNPSVDITKPRGFDKIWYDIKNFEFYLYENNLSDNNLIRRKERVSYEQLLDLLVENYHQKLSAFQLKVKDATPYHQATSNPFSITFAGSQDTGKTTRANELIDALKTVFPHLPVYKYSSIPTKLETGPQICFLNDVVTAQTINSLSILHQLEELGKDGIVVSTSNVQKQLFSWLEILFTLPLLKAFIIQTFVLKEFKKPAIFKPIFKEIGLYRRLGYSGAFLIEGKVENIALSSSCYVESQPGYTYILDKEMFDTETINHQLLLRLEHHRCGTNANYQATTEADRRKTNWHAYFYAESLEDLLSYHSTFTLADVRYNEIEAGKLALRDVTTLAGSIVDPDTFRFLNLTPSNCHATILGFLTQTVKNVPKLHFTLQIGQLFYWTEKGCVLHNKPDITDKYQIIVDKDGNPCIQDKVNLVSVTISDYANFYTNNISTLNVTQTLLMHNLKTLNFIPSGYTEKFDAVINRSADALTLTRSQLYALELKSRFRKTYLYMFIGFFLSLLTGFSLYRLFSQKDYGTKQGKRANLGYGVSKRSGKRYHTTRSGTVYSGEEDFREDIYRDMMERDGFDEEDISQLVASRGKRVGKKTSGWRMLNGMEPDFDFDVEHQAKETNRKIVYLEHDYFSNLERIKSKGGYGMKIVIPRGLTYDNQELLVKDITNRNNHFSTKCFQSVVFDSLGDLLSIDNNLHDMGFTSFSQLRKYLSKDTQFQILTTDKRVPRPYIGLSNQDIVDIYSGKLTYVQTIIDNPINTNKIVSLDDASFHHISITEIDSKPDGRIGGITEFASRPRRYFQVIAFDEPKLQVLTNPVRDTNNFDAVVSRVKANAVIVQGEGRVGGFFIDNDWVLTVKHVLSQPYHTNKVIENLKDGEIEYKVLEVITHPYSDYALLRLNHPAAVGHRSLVNSIYDGPLLHDRIPICLGALSTEEAHLVNARLNNVQMVIDGDNCKPNTFYYTQLDTITNTKLTRAGDCGRPYYFVDGKGVTKILAIHFAGSEMKAYGIRLDKQWIVENIQRSDIKKQALMRYDIPEFCGNLSLVKPAPRILVSPDKPYSEPSKLAGYLGEFLPNMKQPVKTNVNQCTSEEIANLKTNAYGEPDFFLDQILQYNDEVKDFPIERTHTFTSGFISEFKRIFVNHKAGKILSDYQCLNGIMDPLDPLYTYTNSLNWNGSIGYECQTKFRNVHKMSDLVDFNEENEAVFKNTEPAHFISENFDRHVADGWAGVKHHDILQDNLKQENRINEKAYKQRVFTSFPKSLSMYIRKFTLRFASVISKFHSIMPYKIGLDAYSEWHTMHMQAVGFAGSEPLGFGFDLSRCDKHITQQFFEFVLKPLLIHFVEHEHRKNTCNCEHSLQEHLNQIDVVVSHLYHNLVASQDCIYEKFRGNSSGSDLTILINSIYVDWLCFNYFVTAARTSRMFPPTYKAYRELLLVWICGDDAKITVKDFYEFLNFKMMKRYLTTHGITIDTPLKDGNEQPIMKVIDIPFVSRSWVLSPHGYYIPKFKEEVLSGLIYWTSDHSMEHTDNILQLLTEHASAYGREAYEKLRMMIMDYQLDYDSDFLVPTYEESLKVLETRVVGFAIIHKENDLNSS